MPVLFLTGILAVLAPGMQGCGLGTVGIVVALLSGGGDDGGESTPAGPAPSILFDERFEGDLSRWNLAGPVDPVTDADGEQGLGFNPMGDATGNGEAVTRSAFNLDPGLGVRCAMRVPTLGAANGDVWCGVKDSFGADGILDLMAGFFLSSAQSQARMVVDGVIQGTRPLPDTEWHDYEIYLRPDGRVEFFVDGMLVLLSNSRTNPQADYRPVTAGGKSAGVDVRLDNLEVFGFRPVREILFADNFGTDLSAYATAASTGALPTIDPFVTGHPSPALNPGGDGMSEGLAVTTKPFPFVPRGLEVRGDLYVSALGVDTLGCWVGLSHSPGVTGSKQLAAGAELAPAFSGDRIRYTVNNAEVYTEPLPGAGWHAFRILIRPAGTAWRVEFHRNGEPVFVTTTNLNLSYNPNPIAMGGQNVGGTARIDNVAVLAPPQYVSPDWVPLTDAGAAPAMNIQGHVLAYDTKWNRFVVAYGGPNGAASTAVTTLNVAGSGASWASLAPAPASTGGSPLGRTYAAGVWSHGDSSLYLSGGATDATGTARHQDIWKIDFSTDPGGQYARLNTGGPTGRWGHTLVADPERNRLVLFGGRDATGVTNDAWTFNQATKAWNTLTTAGGPPSARTHHGAVFDDANRRMIVFGGENATGNPVADALWALDMRANPPLWTQLSPAAVAGPGPRSLNAVAVLPERRRLFTFGGTDGFSDFGDCFSLDFADGMDGLGSVDLLQNAVGTAHDGLRGAKMAWDPVGDRLVLVGGAGATTTATAGDLSEE